MSDDHHHQHSPPQRPEYTSPPQQVVSPVSPKPVHFPAPSNIPLLELQTNPVFDVAMAEPSSTAAATGQKPIDFQSLLAMIAPDVASPAPAPSAGPSNGAPGVATTVTASGTPAPTAPATAPLPAPVDPTPPVGAPTGPAAGRPSSATARPDSANLSPPRAPPSVQSDDPVWDPQLDRAYEHYLRQERKYLNDDRWDQFPDGSRLFIGNLSAERVKKDQVFQIFHQYGEIVQISFKRAYGFVQYMEAASCANAVRHEQDRMLRGKKLHLEVSKPQQKAGSGYPRRSRSPDGRRNSGGGRDRRRGRDDYRPGRDDHYRQRTPSPRGRRQRTPPAYSEDDSLDLPRRLPHEVPDVQIIVRDELDRSFVVWVENAFSTAGVRVDVLLLSPRMSEPAVVRRQIIEGVVAVSRLSRSSQMSGKIALQIFDRGAGNEEVRFEEYDNLEPAVAAQLVLRAKTTAATKAAAAAAASHNFSQLGLSNMIGQLDPNGLQKLLGALNQPVQPQPAPMQAPPPQQADLSRLLQMAQQQQGAPPAMLPNQYAGANLAALLGQAQQQQQQYPVPLPPPPPQSAQPAQVDMNDILARLAHPQR